VGWLVEQEALSEGVGHARAYIWSRAMPGTSASYPIISLKFPKDWENRFFEYKIGFD